jgi:hypothetical protein
MLERSVIECTKVQFDSSVKGLARGIGKVTGEKPLNSGVLNVKGGAKTVSAFALEKLVDK